MNSIKSAKEIWIVSYFFGSVKAGPVIRFMRYAEFFKQKGYQLVFYTKLRQDEASVAKNESYRAVYIECDSIYSLTKATLHLARSTSVKPNAVIFFSLSYKNYFHLRLARQKGFRLIYVSTMKLDLDSRNGKPRSPLRRSILSFVLGKLYGTMSYIVSSTSELQKELEKLNINNQKLKVISNGVDCAKFKPISKPDKYQERKKLGLSKDAFIFLYVGLFVDRKGVLELIRLFSEFKKQYNPYFILLMVGHEMEINENSNEFVSDWPIAKTSAIEDGWLITHPFAKSIEVYYQMADAFVFNSKLEGMPNVLIEAMSSGLPVVTSKFNGFCDDYGNAGEHFLTFESDTIKDSNTLIKLVRDSELRSMYGGNARSKSLEDFAVQKSIQDYLSLFV